MQSSRYMFNRTQDTTHIFLEEVLANERRRTIYHFVKSNPLAHLRGIHRALKMPLSTLEYHLNYMVRHNVILRKQVGGFSRYWVELLESEVEKLLAILRQKQMGKIILNVLVKGKAKTTDLIEDLGMSSSTISLYLTKLVKQGILERWRIGRENIYTVKDPEHVIKVFTSFQESFDERVRLVCQGLTAWMSAQSHEVNVDEFRSQQVVLHG